MGELIVGDFKCAGLNLNFSHPQAIEETPVKV